MTECDDVKISRASVIAFDSRSTPPTSDLDMRG